MYRIKTDARPARDEDGRRVGVVPARDVQYKNFVDLYREEFLRLLVETEHWPSMLNRVEKAHREAVEQMQEIQASRNISAAAKAQAEKWENYENRSVRVSGDLAESKTLGSEVVAQVKLAIDNEGAGCDVFSSAELFDRLRRIEADYERLAAAVNTLLSQK